MACYGLAQLNKLHAEAQLNHVHCLAMCPYCCQTEGLVVSEFGIGPWRKANEDFLATFECTYQLYEQRIGAPSSVDVVTGEMAFRLSCSNNRDKAST